MSKWICQLPWLTACGVLIAFGVLTFVVLILPPHTEQDKEYAGVGLLAFITGTVGLAAWAVLAFAI